MAAYGLHLEGLHRRRQQPLQHRGQPRLYEVGNHGQASAMTHQPGQGRRISSGGRLVQQRPRIHVNAQGHDRSLRHGGLKACGLEGLHGQGGGSPHRFDNHPWPVWPRFSLHPVVVVHQNRHLVLLGLGNPGGSGAKAIATLGIDQNQLANLARIDSPPLDQRVLITVER